MTHKEKRAVFNWLQKRGALKAYKRARYQVFNRNTRYRHWNPYKYLSFSDPFFWAFNWEATNEGHLYWEKLQEQWFKTH